MLRPEALAGGILLRAMVPLAATSVPGALAGKSVLIVSGLQDPIASPEYATRLAKLLQATGAEVIHRSVPAGHELTQADLTLAREWLTHHPAASTNETDPAHTGPPMVDRRLG
jgi:phospholipase/carboxylesterase